MPCVVSMCFCRCGHTIGFKLTCSSYNCQTAPNGLCKEVLRRYVSGLILNIDCYFCLLFNHSERYVFEVDRLLAKEGAMKTGKSDLPRRPQTSHNGRIEGFHDRFFGDDLVVLGHALDLVFVHGFATAVEDGLLRRPLNFNIPLYKHEANMRYNPHNGSMDVIDGEKTAQMMLNADVDHLYTSYRHCLGYPLIALSRVNNWEDRQGQFHRVEIEESLPRPHRIYEVDPAHHHPDYAQFNQPEQYGDGPLGDGDCNTIVQTQTLSSQGYQDFGDFDTRVTSSEYSFSGASVNPSAPLLPEQRHGNNYYTTLPNLSSDPNRDFTPLQPPPGGAIRHQSSYLDDHDDDDYEFGSSSQFTGDGDSDDSYHIA